ALATGSSARVKSMAGSDGGGAGRCRYQSDQSMPPISRRMSKRTTRRRVIGDFSALAGGVVACFMARLPSRKERARVARRRALRGRAAGALFEHDHPIDGSALESLGVPLKQLRGAVGPGDVDRIDARHRAEAEVGTDVVAAQETSRRVDGADPAAFAGADGHV